MIGKYIFRAVTSLAITQPSIATLVWFITNTTVVTSHISLRDDLTVIWTWWWAASLPPAVVVVIICYFFPRAVTNVATGIFYLLIATPPSPLTGTAEEEQN